jgi:hypothetical protein
MLTKSNPEQAKKLMERAQEAVNMRWKFYEQMAQMQYGDVQQVLQEESEPVS